MIRSELNSTIRSSLGRQWLKKAERAANRVLEIEKDYTVSVALVGKRKIKSLNSCYRKIDKPTDVLSFSGKSKEKFIVGHKTENLGEIVICPEIAKRNAKDAGHGLMREMQALYIHGLLHLLGYAHGRTAKAKEMFSLQDEILKKIK